MSMICDPITFFSEEYRWLSNFWPAPVYYDNVKYPSIENAYQAAKFPPDARHQFTTITPQKAKKLGKKANLDLRWHKEKVTVMRHLISQKFAKSTDLARKLIETYPKKIIEGNTWGDTFWGICNGKGDNNLGILLEQQRSYLMSPLLEYKLEYSVE